MQMFPTCGLWAGVMSLSSCWCCCRQTRPCVGACCSWSCWAIAFSFSGYNWASRERIWRTHSRRWRCELACQTILGLSFEMGRNCVTRYGCCSPDLPASSWPSALSPAAASARSFPSSSHQSSPPPGCLASRSLHPSPLHASSWGKNHLTPGESKEKGGIKSRIRESVERWALKWTEILEGSFRHCMMMLYLYDPFELTVLLQ